MAAPRVPVPRHTRLGADERRAQLALVAARRFHRLGYRAVSLADVGAEVGVTGPAVYRHFRNKEALLAAAITDGLDLVQDAVIRTAGGTLDDTVAAVADVGLRRPDMWVLLQRESRRLSDDLAGPIRDQFAQIVGSFARRLRKERTELSAAQARLLVTAATAVLSLPSTSRTTLPRPRYVAELIGAALACLRADLPDTGERGHRARARPPAGGAVRSTGTRPEQIVDAAVELFARRGYDAVSLDDLGAAVGIAGPSVLHHFETKKDILVTAFDRASDRLEVTQRCRHVPAGGAALPVLVQGYLEYCLANRSLLEVFVTEAMNLPGGARRRATALVRREVDDWTAALLASSPGLGDRVARLRVRAAFAAVNDVVRLGRDGARPSVRADIGAIALAILSE